MKPPLDKVSIPDYGIFIEPSTTGDIVMKLDKNLEIRNLLLDKIERGEWRPGAKLPGARQLAGEVGCCFTHLQSVLESLVQQGILLSVPRSGTYVRENWEKRLLQGTLRLHRAAPEDCTRQVYSAPISQEHPELRLTWKFDRAVYEIQVSHYLLGHHSQYLDLGPIFRKLYPAPSAFFPAPFRQFLVNGKLCGIPLLFSPRIIAYNRELFKQCGVELPRPGWSWEEFIACIRKLRSKLPAERVFPFNHALYEFYPIAARFGGRIIEPDQPDPVRVDAPEMLRGLDHYLMLRDLLGPEEGPVNYTDVALRITTREQLAHELTRENFARIGGVELPMPDNGCDVNVQAAELLCVRNECADLAQAERLIEFLLSEPMQDRIGQSRYGIPVRRSSAAFSMNPYESTDALFLQEMEKPAAGYNLFTPEFYTIVDRSCNLFNRQSREEAVRTVRELGATLRFLTRIGE